MDPDLISGRWKRVWHEACRQSAGDKELRLSRFLFLSFSLLPRHTYTLKIRDEVKNGNTWLCLGIENEAIVSPRTSNTTYKQMHQGIKCYRDRDISVHTLRMIKPNLTLYQAAFDLSSLFLSWFLFFYVCLGARTKWSRHRYGCIRY